MALWFWFCLVRPAFNHPQKDDLSVRFYRFPSLLFLFPSDTFIIIIMIMILNIIAKLLSRHLWLFVPECCGVRADYILSQLYVPMEETSHEMHSQVWILEPWCLHDLKVQTTNLVVSNWKRIFFSPNKKLSIFSLFYFPSSDHTGTECGIV